MNFLIASFGTSGDVLPVIRLGASLRARNHRVGLVAAPSFRPQAEAAGLTFTPATDESGYRAQVRDMPVLLTRYRALYILRHAVTWNERLLAAVRAAQPERPVILSVERPFLWADCQAYATWGNPCLRLLMDAPVPRHMPLPAQLSGERTQARLTARVQQAWQDRLRTTGSRSGPSQIARLQSRVGPRIPRIGLWPAWLSSKDSPPGGMRSFGFLLDPIKLPPERPKGARPLLPFVTGTTGTIAHWEESYRRTAIEVCSALDCDGVMLGASEAARAQPSPPWFRCERFTPLEDLLPDAAAIVHHGGIGTCALALYHAVPQLIVPRIAGQPINAEAMKRLGVARVLAPDQFNAPTATAAVSEMMQRPDYRNRSGVVSSQMQPAQDLANLTQFVEEYAKRSLTPSLPKPTVPASPKTLARICK